jgi:hypothetical protein
MSSRKKISINSVLLDPDNARHGEKGSQRDIYAWMCDGKIGQQVQKLAADIAMRGNSPLETPAVIPAPEGASKPWLVVEGNRRVTALKFLNNPKLCPDPKLRKQYERMKASAEHPIANKIEFVVFENIDMARNWIEVRHGGEDGGLGIISWGPWEFDNFAARFGKRTTNRPAVELLNYAYKKGLIEQSDCIGFPVTTLYRLLSNPVFRKAIGCDLVKGQLYQVSDDKYFDRAVAEVLKILASGQKTVTDLKSKEQRKAFAEELKVAGGWSDYQEQVPRLVNERTADSNDLENGDPAENDGGVESGPKTVGGNATKPRSGTRGKLFTVRGHGLTVPSDETKVHDILRELATLKHSGKQGTPISVAFLLRALLELSSDNYLTVNPDAIRKLEHNTPLREKVKCSAKHMYNKGLLSQNSLDIVLRHCAEDGGMLTISTLQKYLHSTAHFPNGETLNSMWSELKDYIIGCW